MRFQNFPRAVAAIVAVLSLQHAAPAAAESAADGVFGAWITPDMDGIVRIEPCGDSLCGELIWHAYTNVAVTDVYNPDPDLRGRPLLGATVFAEFEADGSKWRGGTLYDPRTGRTYSSKIRVLDEERLKIFGCIGPGLCKGYVWTRVAENDANEAEAQFASLSRAEGVSLEFTASALM